MLQLTYSTYLLAVLLLPSRVSSFRLEPTTYSTYLFEEVCEGGIEGVKLQVEANNIQYIPLCCAAAITKALANYSAYLLEEVCEGGIEGVRAGAPVVAICPQGCAVVQRGPLGSNEAPLS